MHGSTLPAIYTHSHSYHSGPGFDSSYSRTLVQHVCCWSKLKEGALACGAFNTHVTPCCPNACAHAGAMHHPCLSPGVVGGMGSGGGPGVSVLLFVHRVEGVEPGLYCLIRKWVVAYVAVRWLICMAKLTSCGSHTMPACVAHMPHAPCNECPCSTLVLRCIVPYCPVSSLLAVPIFSCTRDA